jgi:AraC-like DNA-binding protein
MYRERVSRLPDTVVWSRVVSPGATTTRILPDGCLDVIWSDGTLVVAGPDTTAQLATNRPGARLVGLRFAHGVGPRVLGLPASELVDTRIPLADLWPATAVCALTDRLAAITEPGLPPAAGRLTETRALPAAGVRFDAGALLEAVAAERLRAAGRPDPVAGMVAARLAAGATVAATAEAVGLSERQLHRRCRADFGYGPKTLARVLRMERAVALARAGSPFAAVAADAGYADQAHLAREMRALAGVPLGVILTG